MAKTEQLPLLSSTESPMDRTDADSPRPALPPLVEYLMLFALFMVWAGFWFAVIWWIV